MYFLYNSPMSLDDFGGWSGNVGEFDQVMGHSLLGHAFLRDSKSGEFAVLYPFRQAYKQYGKFSDLSEFKSSILDDSGFTEYVLLPSHVELISTRLGPISVDQVYIPLPYPHLGGDESPETYAIGKFREFMILVASSHGYE